MIVVDSSVWIAKRPVPPERAHVPRPRCSVRKTIDIIIGTFCIERGHQLLHDDRDFLPMAAHLGLRVL